MTRFIPFGSTPLRGRLALAVPVLLALAAPAAHGQGRGFRPRPFTTPFVMRSTTPRFTTPALAAAARTDALLGRDLRLDPFLRRDLRFDRLLGRDLGLSPWWGTWGGGLWGSGVSVIPAGVPTGTTTAVAQTPTGDTTEQSARAALLLEQAVAERLANRRRAFDEVQYEREKTPTPEQELLNRSRENPPPAEVRSGQALNALLTDLRQVGAGADDVSRPDALLPLDRAALKHINVTRGAGNVAVLKDQGRLAWPAALAGPAYREPRDRLTALAAEAVRRAGRLDPADLRQMAADVAQLRALLRPNKALSFQSFVEVRDFLDRLDEAVAALGRPDAANYFNGTYDLTAQTVLGLVKQMADRGLRFAPAGPGDEPAYAVLREALAAADRAAAVKPQAAAR
jgi:hypothetical protein